MARLDLNECILRSASYVGIQLEHFVAPQGFNVVTGHVQSDLAPQFQTGINIADDRRTYREYDRLVRIGGNYRYDHYLGKHDLSMLVYNYCELMRRNSIGLVWPVGFGLDVAQFKVRLNLRFPEYAAHLNTIIVLDSDLRDTLGVAFACGRVLDYSVPFTPTFPTLTEVRACMDWLCGTGFRDVILKHMCAYYLSYALDSIGRLLPYRLAASVDRHLFQLLDIDSLTITHLPSGRNGFYSGRCPLSTEVAWVVYSSYEIYCSLLYEVRLDICPIGIDRKGVAVEGDEHKVGRDLYSTENQRMTPRDNSSVFSVALFNHVASQFFGRCYWGEFFAPFVWDFSTAPPFVRFIGNGPCCTTFLLSECDIALKQKSVVPTNVRNVDDIFLCNAGIKTWLTLLRFLPQLQVDVAFAGFWLYYHDPERTSVAVPKQAVFRWSLVLDSRDFRDATQNVPVSLDDLVRVVSNPLDGTSLLRLATDLTTIHHASTSKEEEFAQQRKYLLGLHELNVIPGNPIMNRTDPLIYYNNKDVFNEDDIKQMKQQIIDIFPMPKRRVFTPAELKDIDRSIVDYDFFAEFIKNFIFYGPDDVSLGAMRLDFHRRLHAFCTKEKPVGKAGWYFGDVAKPVYILLLSMCPPTRVAYQKLLNFFSVAMHGEVHSNFVCRLARYGGFFLNSEQFGTLCTKIDNYTARTGRCPLTGLNVVGSGFQYSCGMLTNWNILINPHLPIEEQDDQRFKAAYNNANSILGLMNNPQLADRDYGLEEVVDKFGNKLDLDKIAVDFKVDVAKVKALRFRNFGKKYDEYSKLPNAILIFANQLKDIFKLAEGEISRYILSMGDITSDHHYFHLWRTQSTTGAVQQPQSFPKGSNLSRKKDIVLNASIATFW